MRKEKSFKRMKGQPSVSSMAKLVTGGIAVIVVLSLVLGSIAAIAAGHRGVLLTWGKVEDRILPEGISFITPYVNQVVVVPIQTQIYKATASSASADLQIVTTEVAVNYHLEPARVNKIYQNLGLDWEARVIQPAIQEAVKASTAQYTAVDLIGKRPIVKEAIDIALKDKLSPYGIVVETDYITDFKFSPDFEAAIEAKVTAVQLAQKAENDLARIKIEAEQRVAQAKGEADAISVQSQALKENPQYINLQWVNKWDGILPNMLIIGGDGNTPSLILPVESLK